jgi:tetratricopeptide (TPR) repeat protein
MENTIDIEKKKRDWKRLQIVAVACLVSLTVAVAWLVIIPSVRAASLTREAIDAGKGGDIKKAGALLDRAIEIKPRYFLSRFNRGQLYWTQGRNEDALKDLLVAVQIKKRDFMTWYELGKVYSELGRSDDAIASLEKAIDYGFNDIPGLNEDAGFEKIRSDARYKALWQRWYQMKEKRGEVK